MRCTQATLEALGIYGKCPIHGTGVLEAITGAGRKYQFVETVESRHYGTQVGLRTFIEQHPAGSYYLCSEGHAMALVDGKLTDASERKISNRIKVLCAVEVL